VQNNQSVFFVFQKAGYVIYLGRFTQSKRKSLFNHQSTVSAKMAFVKTYYILLVTAL